MNKLNLSHCTKIKLAQPPSQFNVETVKFLNQLKNKEHINSNSNYNSNNNNYNGNDNNNNNNNNYNGNDNNNNNNNNNNEIHNEMEMLSDADREFNELISRGFGALSLNTFYTANTTQTHTFNRYKINSNNNNDDTNNDNNNDNNNNNNNSNNNSNNNNNNNNTMEIDLSGLNLHWLESMEFKQSFGIEENKI